MLRTAYAGGTAAPAMRPARGLSKAGRGVRTRDDAIDNSDGRETGEGGDSSATSSSRVRSMTSWTIVSMVIASSYNHHHMLATSIADAFDSSGGIG